MAVIGAAGGSVATVTQGTVANLTVAVANTEQSYTLPASTKKFMVQARTQGIIKLAFTLGASGTAYHTIWYGAFYGVDGLVAPSTTIYFQSPVAGLVVEVTSWS